MIVVYIMPETPAANMQRRSTDAADTNGYECAVLLECYTVFNTTVVTRLTESARILTPFVPALHCLGLCRRGSSPRTLRGRTVFGRSFRRTGSFTAAKGFLSRGLRVVL